MKRKAQSYRFSKLKNLLPEIQKNVSLKNHSTFKIGGPAKYFVAVRIKGKLIETIRTAKKNNLPFFILGKGGNVLVSDEGYDGLIIKNETSKVKVENSRIFAESGALLEKIVRAAIESRLSGLEWAVGIPGTVGGAICGNAGAFGCSMDDIVENVEALKISGSRIQTFIFKKEDCKFGYRESIFKYKKNLIILSAKFRLKRKRKSKIKKQIKEFISHRQKNQPLGFPSAGSVFKNFSITPIVVKKLFKSNPELEKFKKNKVIPAGYLIESCGLKGKKIGNAKISDIHANFIVNLGGARAKDVRKLIKLAKQKVKKRFGVVLKEEIGYLGFSTLDRVL